MLMSLRKRLPAIQKLDKPQYEALSGFRYAIRAFLAFSEAATRKSGVTPQQYQALLAIKAHPHETILVRDLAKELMLKHNNAVQLVDRLVEAKLVRRSPSKDDKRAVSLLLTAKGEEKVSKLAALHFSELIARQGELSNLSRLATKIERLG